MDSFNASAAHPVPALTPETLPLNKTPENKGKQRDTHFVFRRISVKENKGTLTLFSGGYQ